MGEDLQALLYKLAITEQHLDDVRRATHGDVLAAVDMRRRMDAAERKAEQEHTHVLAAEATIALLRDKLTAARSQVARSTLEAVALRETLRRRARSWRAAAKRLRELLDSVAARRQNG